MFWLQAIRFIPKALPTRATCDPIRPSPRTPTDFPRRSVPTVCCQRSDRRGGPEIRRCPLDRGAPTNRRSQAPHFGNRPEQRSCTSSLASIPRLLIRPFLSRDEGSVYQIVSLFVRD